MLNKAIMASALWIVACAVSAQAWSAEGKVSVGTGFNFSSGDYGSAATTRIRTIPVDLGYEAGAWSFKMSVPYLDVSGPANVIPGVGRVENNNLLLRGGIANIGLGGSAGMGGTPASQTSGKARGLGDITTAASYSLFSDSHSPFGVDLSARVKFATADENKGLGTGENDYGASLDVSRRFDRITAFGGVGYTKIGSSSNIKLNNVANASAGASFKLSQASTVGLVFDFRERLSDNGAPRREATAFYNYRPGQGWKAQLYMQQGFSDGSAEYGAGVSAGYSF